MSRVQWQSLIFEKNSHLAKNDTFLDFDKKTALRIFDFDFDFVYGVRGDDYLTSCENRMSGKIRSIFRNHILHTNPKKMLFFPKKNQKNY